MTRRGGMIMAWVRFYTRDLPVESRMSDAARSNLTCLSMLRGPHDAAREHLWLLVLCEGLATIWPGGATSFAQPTSSTPWAEPHGDFE